MTAPVHRIYWLDDPQFDDTQRRALIRAFDEAASYDESSRTALAGGTPLAVAGATPFRAAGHASRGVRQ